MKIVYLMLISIFLNANCNSIEAKEANVFFYEATQTEVIREQLSLLEHSLKLCFTYEAKLTLLNLQAEQEPNKKKKLKLYDQALESLSQIKNNDDLVRSEQARINKLIAKIYEKNSPLLSDIYRKKANAQKEVESEDSTNYFWWIVSILVGFLWVFWDFVKKWGKF